MRADARTGWLIVLAGLMLAVAPAATTMAAPPQFDAASQVISVSPVIIDQRLDAGRLGSFSVHIANQTTRPWHLLVHVTGLSPKPGDGGDLDISAAAARRDASAVSWLKPDVAAFDLAAGAERDVHVAIRVPANASPGGHYAALQLQPVAPAEAGVSVSAQITELVLLGVGGSAEPRLDVSVHAAHRISLSTPLAWHVRLHNGGNVHQLVIPRLLVDPLLSGRARVTGRPLVIFPGQTRSFDLRAPVRLSPDSVSATLELSTQRSSSRSSGSGIGGSPRDSFQFVERTHAGRTLLLPVWFICACAALAAVIWWRLRVAASRRIEHADAAGLVDDQTDELDD